VKIHMTPDRMRILIGGSLWLLIAILLRFNVPEVGEDAPIFTTFAVVWFLSFLYGCCVAIFQAGKWLWNNAEQLAFLWNERFNS